MTARMDVTPEVEIALLLQQVETLENQRNVMQRTIEIAAEELKKSNKGNNMSLLSYNQLCQLVEENVIGPVDPKDINAASIDVHLGNKIIVERYSDHRTNTVDIKKRQLFDHSEVDITNGYYDLQPNEFILAQTAETFNLPDDICAEFKLKSSGARTGLENALATWCDAGWHGSVLTLELKNFLRYHTLKLTAGMAIGQMIFYRVPLVPKERSYATIGRYNKDQSVQVVKL